MKRNPEEEKLGQVAQAIADEGKHKSITIRFPESIWKRLRDAQTDGKIKSIQQAAIEGTLQILESMDS